MPDRIDIHHIDPEQNPLANLAIGMAGDWTPKQLADEMLALEFFYALELGEFDRIGATSLRLSSIKYGSPGEQTFLGLAAPVRQLGEYLTKWIASKFEDPLAAALRFEEWRKRYFDNVDARLKILEERGLPKRELLRIALEAENHAEMLFNAIVERRIISAYVTILPPTQPPFPTTREY